MSHFFIENDFSLVYNFKNEDSDKGNLSRLFINVLEDYFSGNISFEEKNNQSNSIILVFESSNASSNSEVVAWIEIVSKLSLAANVYL